MSSIGNLDAAARRLGLVKADHPALIRLPDGKMIGVPTPPDGKPAVTAQDAKTDQGEAATPETDKGAANIVPNGVTQPGLTPNGTATTGGRHGADGNGTALGTARRRQRHGRQRHDGQRHDGNGTTGNGTAGTAPAPTGTGQ